MKYAAPSTDDCPMCDKPLGSVELLKRPGGWVHKDCWLREKGE